jgi:hypothetical protein
MNPMLLSITGDRPAMGKRGWFKRLAKKVGKVYTAPLRFVAKTAVNVSPAGILAKKTVRLFKRKRKTPARPRPAAITPATAPARVITPAELKQVQTAPAAAIAPTPAPAAAIAPETEAAPEDQGEGEAAPEDQGEGEAAPEDQGEDE